MRSQRGRVLIRSYQCEVTVPRARLMIDDLWSALRLGEKVDNHTFHYYQSSMSSEFKFPPFDIPTLDDLDVDFAVLDGLAPIVEATKWFAAFRTNTHDSDLITSLFHELGFWNDILALTWNYRTIRGTRAIKHLLDSRLAQTGLTALSLAEDSFRAPTMLKPMPGVVFLRLCFEFETNYGRGTAIAFLVPTSNTRWKAWSLLTRLESLKDYPERVSLVVNTRASHGHHVRWVFYVTPEWIMSGKSDGIAS